MSDYSPTQHKTKRVADEIMLDLLDPRRCPFDRRTYQGARDWCLLQLLAQTGMRCSEVAGLRIEHLADVMIDGSPATLLSGFRAKGNRERQIVLAGAEREFLLAYLRRRPGPQSGPLFWKLDRHGSPILGESITRHVVYWVVRTFGHDRGVEGLHPHRFRHSLASRMAEDDGATVFDLCAWFGWSEPKTAAMYVHLSPRRLMGLNRNLWGAARAPRAVAA